ncbi:MAG TPA: hypothetical protein VGL83_19740 [Stellaceae bacterium]|jgi:hypothetical protein
MSDLSTKELRRIVLKGLRRVGERFAEDPTPTDGTIRAAIAKLQPKRKKPAMAGKQKARTRSKASGRR